MSNKGFTLLETLLVLSALSVIMACFPLLRTNANTILSYRLKEMYEKLLMLQHEAMTQKRIIEVSFQGNTYIIDGKINEIGNGIYCDSVSFSYTATGTISHADTLTCGLHGRKKEIVWELGTGRMYVR